MPLVLSRKQLDKIEARRVRFAAYVLAYTGQPYLQPHPYLFSYRFCWSSTFPRTAIVAKH